MAGMSRRHRSLARFGLAVRRTREAKGLTQERLAERGGRIFLVGFRK